MMRAGTAEAASWSTTYGTDGMAAMIDEVLKRLAERGNFGQIVRLDYTEAMSADELMQEAEAVGRFRSDAFVIDKGLLFAYQNIARWIVGDREMRCMNPATGLVEAGDLRKGLYVAGRTGCGKTWALDIYGYLAKAHSVKYRAYGEDVPLDLSGVRADDITTDFMRTGETEKYEGRRVLLINDLGTEPEEVIYMGNRVNVLRQLLEKRADNPARITVITSNIPLTKMEVIRQRYGDRVASRLVQMCNYIEIKGDDKRK